MRNRLLAALSTLVLMLVAGEVAARVLLASHWQTERLREQQGRFSIKSLIEFDDDPELLYRLRRNLATTFHESKVRTDDKGVRTGSGEVPDPEGAIRIALIGDSTAFGWRVDYEDTYGEKLRAALEVEARRPVVLQNHSVPGYNASQERRALARVLPVFRPDLVIVHHDHNDSQATGWGYGGWVPPEYGDNAFHSAFLKLVLRRIRMISDRVSPPPESGEGERVDGYSVSGPPYEVMMESRKALVQDARDLGIPVLIVIFHADVAAEDDYTKSERWNRLHRQASERFREMGYLVLDLYPYYQRLFEETGTKDLRALWMDAEDHHPNAAGHKFISDVLLEYIQETPELRASVLGSG